MESPESSSRGSASRSRRGGVSLSGDSGGEEKKRKRARSGGGKPPTRPEAAPPRKDRKARGSRRTGSKASSRPRMKGSWAQWKIMAILVGVCAGAALITQILFNTDVTTLAGVLLFRSTDVYISSKRQGELNKEFTDMVKKEFGGGLPGGRSK